jgi:hypothetical protein
MARRKGATALRVATRTFHVHKRGGTESEYEDAFFPDEFTDELGTFRCAVADGASESAFANIWAQLLVRGFATKNLRIAELQQYWQKTVGSKKMPWFLEKKARRGAFAAFVGLSLRGDGVTTTRARKAAKKSAVPSLSAADWMPSTGNGTTTAAPPAGWRTQDGCSTDEIDGTWRAFAVGDSCLFQVRNNELITVGPVCESSQFDNSPFLLGSKSKETIQRNASHVSVHSGTLARGDLFYLATDAMSQWLLLRLEAEMPPWDMLRDLGADDTRPFDDLVDEMRSEHDLHNDDTTLMRVEVS